MNCAYIIIKMMNGSLGDFTIYLAVGEDHHQRGIKRKSEDVAQGVKKKRKDPFGMLKHII